MPSVEPSDVYKAAVELIKNATDASAKWAANFFTVQALLLGSLGVVLGVTRAEPQRDLPVSLDSVLIAVGFFGVVFSLALPWLYERAQISTGRYMQAVRKAEGTLELHLYDDAMMRRVERGWGSSTGWGMAILGVTAAFGWALFIRAVLSG